MSLQVVFRHLVESLRGVKSVRSVKVLDQGALHVTVSQPNFIEDIMVYVLAGELSVGFVKKTLNANTQRDMHTLFIVSLDLITDDGVTANMSDALRLLLQAYGGKVYAYDQADGQVLILPVRVGQDRRVKRGEPVNLADLSGDYATFDNKYLLGVRKVAGFVAHQYHAPAEDLIESAVPQHMQPYYDLLHLDGDVTVSDVKRAYRRMARRYHPDTDPSPDATSRMQRINEAYTRILEHLTEV